MAKLDMSVNKWIGLERSWWMRMGADKKADFKDWKAERAMGVRENLDGPSLCVRPYKGTAIVV